MIAAAMEHGHSFIDADKRFGYFNAQRKYAQMVVARVSKTAEQIPTIHCWPSTFAYNISVKRKSQLIVAGGSLYNIQVNKLGAHSSGVDSQIIIYYHLFIDLIVPED